MSTWAFGARAGSRCARLVPVIALWLSALSAGCASSLKLTLLATAARPPSDVALLVDVADARGRAVVGLAAKDFRLYEDGKLVSAEAAHATLADSELAAQHYTLLLIELSSGSVVADQVGAIRTAAQAWLAEVGAHQRVAVYAFDGSKGLYEIVAFHDGPPDAGQARALDALRSLQVRDPATNLNGAVLLGLAELDRVVQASQAPLHFGSLVVLTDGSDRANRISQRQMLDAVEAAPHRVFSLGIGRDVDDSVLSRVGKSGYVRVEENAAAGAAFRELAALVVRASRRQYLLRYCSAARAGRRVLTVEAEAEAGRGQTHFVFDATGFSASCDQSQPPVLTPRTRRASR
jgi:hypothetical protein